MNFLKGNRTRIFGTAILVLGVVQEYAREVIPAEWQGLTLAAVGIAIVVLREITSTAPGTK